MDEIVSDSNFAFGIPSKTNKNDKKNIEMKKKIYTIMSMLLIAGLCYSTPTIPDDEEEEEHKREKNEHQEGACYNITSTYYSNTGMLAIRFGANVSHVDIYAYKNGEPIIALEDLSKANGSTEWINLNCYGSGEYTIYVMVDNIIASFIEICI
ncbi:MAG: hypothetical protein J6N21_00940 [Butyrivibrio sp.]|nr:hypothetical protein [Butyrivibrio sp.]